MRGSAVGGLAGAAAAGIGLMRTLGSTGAAIGSDLTNQMGVGHPGYVPDFSAWATTDDPTSTTASSGTTAGSGPDDGPDPDNQLPAAASSGTGRPDPDPPRGRGPRPRTPGGGAAAGGAPAGEVAAAAVI